MEHSTDEINLRLLFYVICKCKKLMFIFAAVGLLLGSLFTGAEYFKKTLHPKSAITASLAIATRNTNGKYFNNAPNPGYQDIRIASEIAESVIQVAKSDRTLEAAVEKLNLIAIRPSEIKSNLQITQVGISQIINITLNWDNAGEGINILTAISEILPDILIETLDLGSVSVVDYPADQGYVRVKIHWYLPILTSLGFVAFAAVFNCMKLQLHPTILDTAALPKYLKADCLGAVTDGRQAEVSLSAAAHLLRHRMQTDALRCIYVTSSQRDEGKTGVCAALGRELAKQGLRVLLVDMDAGEPALGRSFFPNIAHEKSLNAFISGEKSFDEVLLNVTPNLHLLARRIEDDMNEDLLLAALKERRAFYDLILLDTAPIGVASDALLLNNLAEGAVMVARYDTVWIEAIAHNLQLIEKTGTKVLGTIVTGVSQSGEKNYDYYGSKSSATLNDLPVREKKRFRLRKKKAKDEQAENQPLQ